MQIPIIVETVGTERFRAQGLAPFLAVAEGKTTEEAVCKLRDEIRKEIEGGKRVVMLDIPTKDENPWLAMAGWLKDDPLYGEWRAEVEAYRDQCDIEAGINYQKPT